MTTASTGQVTSQAAELYEQFYLPALFAQWPERLLALSGARPGHDVLDVACGTGVCARRARTWVGPEATVCGVDVNPGMLAVAARTGPGVRWIEGPAESLPLEDCTFDHVVCQFGLMFFTDRRAALAEMARVARPGGRICVATWAGLEESPGYAAMVGLLDELFGKGPSDALAAPFAIGTIEELTSVVGGVLGPVTVQRLDGTARFPSVDAWVDTDARAWTLDELLDDGQLRELRAQARVRLADFCDDSGRVEFPAPALVATMQT